MKKICMQVLLMLMAFYIHAIPMEEWDALSKAEKKERLEEGVNIIKQELRCDNPKITSDISEQFIYLHGECGNRTYIGFDKGHAPKMCMR